MAIGTKVKVGFDGSAVKAGVSKLSGMFKGLGKTVGRIGRQVAIGGARRGGETLFGLAMRGAQAIPAEINRLADYSAELQNVARDTKVATGEVVAMHKALQLQGMDADMAADTFREFATKMGEAAKEADSEPMKALMDLGIFQPDIRGQSVSKQMDIMAAAVKNFSGSQQDLAFIMDRFLGGDLGLKAIGFFQNYEDSMAEGARLTESFAKQLENSAGGLKDIVRLRSALSQKFSEFTLGVFGVGRGRSGGIVEAIENFDMAKKGEEFAKIMRNTFIYIRQNGGLKQMFADSIEFLKTKMQEAGELFGIGVRKGLFKGAAKQSIMQLPGVGQVLKSLDFFKGDDSPFARLPEVGKKVSGGVKDTSEDLLDKIKGFSERSANLLQRIERKNGGVYQ